MDGLDAVADALGAPRLQPADAANASALVPVRAAFNPLLDGFQTLAGREGLAKLAAAVSLFAAD